MTIIKKRMGICWAKECEERHTGRIKMEFVYPNKSAITMDGKFCKKHFIDAWEYENFGYLKLANDFMEKENSK